MRLRTLLAFAFGLTALAVALCGAFGAQVLTGERLKQRIGVEMATAAGQVRNVLDRSMYSRWRDISILASVAETSAKTADARRSWVDSMRRTFPAYAWIGFADAQGTVTVATGRMLEGVSVNARPWFQAGLQKPYAGDLHEAVLLANNLPAAPDGAPWRFVDLSAPVHDAAGHLDGVVGAHLSWSWAKELTQSVLAPLKAKSSSTDVLVINDAGVVILGPPDLQDMAVPKGSVVWQAARNGDTFALETWQDGRTYLVGASRTAGMNEYPGLGWTVLVRQSAKVAFAPAFKLARELLLGGIVLSGIAAVLGWLTAWWISRPVLALANAAEALGRVPGWTAPLPAQRGTEEVRRLSSALSSMLRAVAARDRSLAEANQELEQRVETRTQEVQAARLLAEAASQAKSRFLAGMTHELRTPLHGMLGYAALLRDDGGLTETQLQRADAMIGTGRHLLEMINRVLDISEIEAGRMDMCLAAVDVVPLARACLDLVGPTALRKNLALEFQAAEARLCVMADPTRLRQILLNLLGNAVKFTDRGSVSLRLHSVPERNVVRLEVVDTGPGIPADRRQRLFQEFERLGASADMVEGTGLGLALSARLATMMGGRLGYEEHRAGGSVFWLEMPISAAAVVPEMADCSERRRDSQPWGGMTLTGPETDGGAGAATDDGGPLRILIVDDMEINRDIAAAFLSGTGYEVTCADSGEAGIAHARTDTFDVILMDVRMPGMDGLEATRRIRALAGRYGRVPIVALTAQAFAEQISDCQKAGMDAHLSKPFSREALIAAVTSAAAAGRASISAAAVASPTAFAEV